MSKQKKYNDIHWILNIEQSVKERVWWFSNLEDIISPFTDLLFTTPVSLMTNLVLCIKGGMPWVNYGKRNLRQARFHFSQLSIHDSRPAIHVSPFTSHHSLLTTHDS